jgi:hypothetical protein
MVVLARIGWRDSKYQTMTLHPRKVVFDKVVGEKEKWPNIVEGNKP